MGGLGGRPTGWRVLLLFDGQGFEASAAGAHGSGIATIASNDAAARLRAAAAPTAASWLAIFASPAAPRSEGLAVGALGLTELAAVLHSSTVEGVFLASERQAWAIELDATSALWNHAKRSDTFRALMDDTIRGGAEGARSSLRLIEIGAMRMVQATVNGPELAELLSMDGWARVYWDRPVTVLKH